MDRRVEIRAEKLSVLRLLKLLSRLFNHSPFQFFLKKLVNFSGLFVS
jgi:hypothetical protein